LASACWAVRRFASALSIEAWAEARLAGDGVVVVDVVVVPECEDEEPPELELVDRERVVDVVVVVRVGGAVVVRVGVVVVGVPRAGLRFLGGGVGVVVVVVVVCETNTGALGATVVDAELALPVPEPPLPDPDPEPLLVAVPF
jgi:hypothetical protein